MSEPFEIDTIELTSRDPRTGVHNTAYIYRLDTIDRDLSIGQLCMALCLEKATAYESSVVEIMAEMNNTTVTLERLSSIESLLTTKRNAMSSSTETLASTWTGLGVDDETRQTDYPVDDSSEDAATYWDHWLVDYGGVDLESSGITVGSATYTGTQLDTIISAIETRMDSLNTFSQQKMIELQSETNKRDQAYDLASAIIKSCNTVMTGNVNNM